LGFTILEKPMDTALVVISPLKGFVCPSGKILLTQKFIDGMMLYREFWNGPLIHLCEPASSPSDNLDNVEIDTQHPAFQTYCREFSDENLKASLPKSSVVLVSVGEAFNHVSSICKDRGISCVYVAEYSLRTRLEIAGQYQRNIAHGAWSKLRQLEQEYKQRRAISLSSGVQCNGLPTFGAYKSLTSSLLFFDSRIDEGMLASNDQLVSKMHRRAMTDKIHLVFSGRINRMKGVDDLPVVASHLRELGIDFEMTICGDGEYLPKLRASIAAKNLEERVKLAGVLDFKTQLMPFVTEYADLFVNCHRQGDPSCTYLETMACGVPIVGYANDAFYQLVNFANVGWLTEMSNPRALAVAIQWLHNHPEKVDHSSLDSYRFARKHTFRDSFKRRIEHIKDVSQQVF
jgi:glycosyltransferase involved in cell wall biosynthesis